MDEAETYALERLIAKAVPVSKQSLTLSLPSIEVSSLAKFFSLVSTKDLTVYHDEKNFQFLALYNHVVHTARYGPFVKPSEGRRV